MKQQKGFTLVEMAIVLVIIGLIMGMAFKGRELIEGARVKSMAATVNKTQAAMNTFFERYQFYPGDGCAAAGATSPANCVGQKNGLLAGGPEVTSFYTLLATPAAPANPLLPDTDFQGPFGQRWGVIAGGGANTAANTTYLAITNIANTTPSNAVAAAGAPGYGTVDVRYACALDKMIDDGVPNTGNVRSNAATYNAATVDCWGLANAQVTLAVRILP